MKNIKTCIQNGNLIFNSDKPNSELENDLEKVLTFSYELDKFKTDNKDAFIFCKGKITNQNLSITFLKNN